VFNVGANGYGVSGTVILPCPPLRQRRVSSCQEVVPGVQRPCRVVYRLWCLRLRQDAVSR